jgi:hypothetical protein
VTASGRTIEAIFSCNRCYLPSNQLDGDTQANGFLGFGRYGRGPRLAANCGNADFEGGCSKPLLP